MHPNQELGENLAIIVPCFGSKDLIEERLAQAVAVDKALRRLLHGEISHDVYIQMIESVIGHTQIDDYLEEVIINLENA